MLQIIINLTKYLLHLLDIIIKIIRAKNITFYCTILEEILIIQES